MTSIPKKDCNSNLAFDKCSQKNTRAYNKYLHKEVEKYTSFLQTHT